MYTTHFLAGTVNCPQSMQDLVQRAVAQAYTRVHALLGLETCTVLVMTKEGEGKGMLGRYFGGDVGAFYVAIHIAEATKLLQEGEEGEEKFIKKLSHYIYAGLYATVRLQKNGEAECKLLEEVVEEGLVTHFVREICGDDHTEDIQLSEEEIERLYKELKENCDNKEISDISMWFTGSKDKHIPTNAASVLGYRLVDTYLKKGSLKSTDVLEIPANCFTL